MHKRPWRSALMNRQQHGCIMHPRNPYNENPPDFVALAKKYPTLREYVNVSIEGKLRAVDDELDASEYAWKGVIDFKAPKALRELTYCLFRHDFGLEVEFPLDSLCPTIPNRVNYVCWIEDLIGPERENVVGIDIGVGASCVYPLLVCARQNTWRMVGTEIDVRSLEYASKNVERNRLNDRISIVKNPNAEKTLPLDLFPEPNQTYDFCMCNPPFFEDDDDYLTSLSFKQDAPAAALQATDSELKTSGGEVEFIKRMIDESRILQTRIRWYTTMIGKKSTVKTIISYLRQYSIHNFTVTTFRQGRTFRWAIAWSYHPEHAPKSTWTSLSKDLQTLKQVMSFSLPDRDPEKIFSSIESILELLDISVQTVHDGAEDVSCAHIIQGEAFSHSWSRAARRAKARQAQAKEQSHTSLPVSPTTTIVRSEGQEPVLGFELQVRADAQPPFEHATKKQRVESSQNDADKNKITETVTVEVSWLVGKDRELFESFVKHLRSRLEAEKN